MEMSTERPHIVLAIEAAIEGGSLALQRDAGRIIAKWTGNSTVSKAEELLVNIDELLKSNNLVKRDISLIAVSAGPGSFTGIRIGIATALGLKAGLGVPSITVSLLDAMITGINGPSSPQVTSAVPVGRGAVCSQDFHLGDWTQTETSEPVTIRESDFLERVQSESGRHFYLHRSLYEKAGRVKHSTDSGHSLAEWIGYRGLLDSMMKDKTDVEPIFVSKSF